MKIIPNLVAASLASLLLASASEAALISVTIDVVGTIEAMHIGTDNGSFVGTYNDVTGQILAAGSTHPLTPKVDAVVGYTIDVTGLAGTSVMTSCASNPAAINLCTEDAGLGLPPFNDLIGVPRNMHVMSNTVNSSGNGVFTTMSASESAILASTYTVTAVPVPAAAWLFGSALVGLTCVARRRNSTTA